jgi:hypothetical protein
MQTTIPPGRPMVLPNAPAGQRTHEVAADGSTPRFEQQYKLLAPLHLADALLSRSADDPPLTDQSAAETAALVRVAQWAKEFLTQPHPALGRGGQVCPFVGPSIREQRFMLTVLRGAGTRPADDAILRLGRHFRYLEPVAGRAAQLKTIVVLLPDLPQEQAADVINGLHRRVKPHFLRDGLMLGEFFKDSSKPGLHNPDFRPLRSDTPLLVIRAMVLTDIAFLTDRASFVRAFLENFEARGCGEILSYVERRGSCLSESQSAMLLEQVAAFQASPSGWAKAVPSVPSLTVAASAPPATEVGGAMAGSQRGRCPFS